MNCQRCGECCRSFNVTDDEYLTREHDTLIIKGGKCNFLVGKICTIHGAKPEECKEFFCAKCK